MSAPNGPFAAGRVTIIDADPGRPVPVVGAPIIPAPPPFAPRPGSHRAMLWYGGIAGVVLAAGLIVVLVLVLDGRVGSGHGPLAQGRVGPPADAAPPLAKLCPAPSVAAPPGPAGDAPPAGPRTVDSRAGISYRAYGAPWRPWTMGWSQGTLAIPYGAGQFFVTEEYPGGQYLATILSGAVPATVNDGTAIDIECTGKQVAADVRVSYYPQPTTMDAMRSGLTSLGGRPAWVTEFRLHFHAAGLQATDELVGVAVIDVGRPTAAVLYVSIPGTHRQWDHVVDEVLDSVQPT